MTVLAVFGWAFLSFWSAIPGGIALELSPVVTVLTAVVSYGCGAALVVIVGEPVQRIIRHRMQQRPAAMPAHAAAGASVSGGMGRMMQGAWDRFGLVGLAVLSPMTVGSLTGAVIGLALGIPRLRLILMMTLGAGLWGVLIGLAVMMGLLTAAGL